MSIFDNIAYGLRLKGIRKISDLSERVERALNHAALGTKSKTSSMQALMNCPAGSSRDLLLHGPSR